MSAALKIHTRRGELIELAALVVKTRLPLKLVAHHLGVVLSVDEERGMSNLIAVSMQDLRQMHYDQIGKGECP